MSHDKECPPPRPPTQLPPRLVTFGVGCARPTMACLSGVVATALISRLCGSSCVTVVKKGGPGREDPGKCVDEPLTSLWPRKYSATCLRMVDVRGPLSCWTAARRRFKQFNRCSGFCWIYSAAAGAAEIFL